MAPRSYQITLSRQARKSLPFPLDGARQGMGVPRSRSICCRRKPTPSKSDINVTDTKDRAIASRRRSQPCPYQARSFWIAGVLVWTPDERVVLSRKEVIQPHLPIRLPCYDFTPVIDHTVASAPLAVKLPASGATNSHGVTGGVYKARERIHRDNADSRLLAIPTSWSRVADSNPDWDRLSGIGSTSRYCNPLYRPL